MADAPAIEGLELQRESTAEQVAGALRDLIVNGQLTAGTYLRESPLSGSLGVSRNTVREATQILVGEGLVTREMHRGAFVTRLDVDDVHDLYRVRRLVELAAVREAVTGVSLEQVRAGYEALAATAERGDQAGVVDCELAFHRALVDVMQSERLGNLFKGVEAELRLSLALGEQAYPDPSVLVDQDRAVLEALEAGDGDTARGLMAAHLDDAEGRIAGLVEQRAQPVADAASAG